MNSNAAAIHVPNRYLSVGSSLFLAIISGVALLTTVGLVSPILSVSTAFFMIVPGYAISLLLFPLASRLERLFLSIGFSLGLLIGLQLIFEANGFRLGGLNAIILSSFSVLLFSVKTIRLAKGADG